MATANLIDTETEESRAAVGSRAVLGDAEMEHANGDQRVDLPGISWDLYVAINDAVGEKPGVRMIYGDGRLSLLTTSRQHDWFAELLGALVQALANRLEIPWEIAGQATYRSPDKKVGIEGDKTFYFREHAILMSGPVNIDLAVQPPPDLAIEIVVSHPASTALISWGKLGVPEVWVYEPNRNLLTFRVRSEDGTYLEASTSLAFPGLASGDLLEAMKEAAELRAFEWFKRINSWIETIAQKLGK